MKTSITSFFKYEYSNFLLLDCMLYYNQLSNDDILFISNKLLNTINNDILVQIVLEEPDSDKIKTLFRQYIDSLNLNIINYPRQMVVEYFKLINNDIIGMDEAYNNLFVDELYKPKWDVDIFCDFFQIYEFIEENPNSEYRSIYLKFLNDFIAKCAETNGAFELAEYQLVKDKETAKKYGYVPTELSINLSKSFISNIWDNFLLLDCMLFYEMLMNYEILVIVNTLLNNMNNPILIEIAVQDTDSEMIKPLFRKFLNGFNFNIQNYPKQLVIEYFKLTVSNQVDFFDGIETLWRLNYTNDYKIMKDGSYDIYLIYDLVDWENVNKNNAVKLIKNEITKYIETNGNYKISFDKAFELATSTEIQKIKKDTPITSNIQISSNENNAYKTEIYIEILNYQFPEGGYDYWDNNWYYVKITIKQDNNIILNKKDSCITSFELQSFGQNIKDLDRETMLSEYFTEPVLEFIIKPKNNKTLFCIKVLLNNDDLIIKEFEVDWQDIKNISKQIDNVLEKFPIRDDKSIEKTNKKSWFKKIIQTFKLHL